MIHCIGNSHITIFSKTDEVTKDFKNDEFCSFHLGTCTAYNFTDKHFHTIQNYLRTCDKDDKVILVAGEVDCRIHIPKQADEQQRPDFSVAQECLDRFTECMLRLKDFPLVGFGTIPTTSLPGNIEPHLHSNSYPDQPRYGNWERRNQICWFWNQQLEMFCERNSIPYFSIYNELVDSNNKILDEYLIDYCHINSNKVISIIQEKLRLL